jgi:hypothetical protein
VTYEEAVEIIEAASFCPKCHQHHSVVMRKPIGGWAAYLYCMNDDCEYAGSWDKLTWTYYATKEEAEKAVIALAPDFE